jgi:hypothetical protein
MPNGGRGRGSGPALHPNHTVQLGAKRPRQPSLKAREAAASVSDVGEEPAEFRSAVGEDLHVQMEFDDATDPLPEPVKANSKRRRKGSLAAAAAAAAPLLNTPAPTPTREHQPLLANHGAAGGARQMTSPSSSPLTVAPQPSLQSPLSPLLPPPLLLSPSPPPPPLPLDVEDRQDDEVGQLEQRSKATRSQPGAAGGPPPSFVCDWKPDGQIRPNEEKYQLTNEWSKMTPVERENVAQLYIGHTVSRAPKALDEFDSAEGRAPFTTSTTWRTAILARDKERSAHWKAAENAAKQRAGSSADSVRAEVAAAKTRPPASVAYGEAVAALADIKTRLARYQALLERGKRTAAASASKVEKETQEAKRRDAKQPKRRTNFNTFVKLVRDCVMTWSNKVAKARRAEAKNLRAADFEEGSGARCGKLEISWTNIDTSKITSGSGTSTRMNLLSNMKAVIVADTAGDTHPDDVLMAAATLALAVGDWSDAAAAAAAAARADAGSGSGPAPSQAAIAAAPDRTPALETFRGQVVLSTDVTVDFTAYPSVESCLSQTLDVAQAAESAKKAAAHAAEESKKQRLSTDMRTLYINNPDLMQARS